MPPSRTTRSKTQAAKEVAGSASAKISSESARSQAKATKEVSGIACSKILLEGIKSKAKATKGPASTKISLGGTQSKSKARKELPGPACSKSKSFSESSRSKAKATKDVPSSASTKISLGSTQSKSKARKELPGPACSKSKSFSESSRSKAKATDAPSDSTKITSGSKKSKSKARDAPGSASTKVTSGSTISKEKATEISGPATKPTKIKSIKHDKKLSVKESNKAVSGKENATLITTSSINNRIVKQTLVFETETVPELGSDAMFDAIFKAAKVNSGLTQDDLDMIEYEKAKFWGRSPKSLRTKVTKIPNVKITESKSTFNSKKNKSQDDALDFGPDQETLDLLAEAHAILNGTDDQSSSVENSQENNRALQSPTKYMPEPEVMEVMDVDTELEDPESEEADDFNPLGDLVFFQVQLKGVKYPIRLRQHSKIREVRQMVAKKAGIEAACLTMFIGDYTKMDDSQTVYECGLTDLCNVDAYYAEKTDKELYLADSMDVFRFKMQTDDRRGRQTTFVYSKKTATMRSVRDQYAKIMGIDASQLRLMFDGDHINLDMIPEDCDLEGEECIDVIIKQ